MKIIGLTGGIGSGKSTVADLFRTLSIPVYESDARAKNLMNTNAELRNKIEKLLGPQSYINGEINRPWIAEKVFGNKDLLQQLNSIVHPAVRTDAVTWANAPEQANHAYVIKESAILFEENSAEQLDGIILVVAPIAIRIERVMKRDGISKDQVDERIQHQWTDEMKIPLSDYVVYNDGERSIIEQVIDIDRMIRATIEN
ncbi:MAG TPA: dephospho-CoA kinase [Saprospiraceae bacterium]|nr:dephospho-CoA kinase [Saprospiraceae bacterium]